MSYFDGLRARLRLLKGRSSDTRYQREFAFHLEMETERLVREEGFSPVEARRRAAVAFGGVEKHNEDLRSDRDLAWLNGTLLDVKLAVRLLFKHPGFTLVSGFGIMVATAFMSGLFAYMYTNIYPKLPLPEGDRIVALENWNLRENNEAQRSLHDFVTWRREMKSVGEISAFFEYETSLSAGNTLVNVASMTASAFHLARVAPLKGRYLTEEDEREGAADVLVIGYDAWRARFGEDADVVGREVRLGRRVHTIVGVMPKGFGFPRSHQYWVPFRLDPLRVKRGDGPALFVFGRLAPGASQATAQTELTAIGQRAAAEYPLTNASLLPKVWPYTASLLDIQGVGTTQLVQMELMSSLVLLIVALNVAILVYARTAMRRGEIAVRTALGASRARIAVQLFAEAFVLALLPALLGIPVAQLGMRLGNAITDEDLGGHPFWADLSLQPATVIHTLVLVVVAAAVIGVIPALRATGKHVQGDIRQLGGSTGMKLGRAWTLMIATQVAVAVAALPSVAKLGLREMRGSFERRNFSGEFVSFGVGLTEAYDSLGARDANALFGANAARLMTRLASDADVAGVTFTGRAPEIEIRKQIEVAGQDGQSMSVSSTLAQPSGIDTAGFRVLGLPMLAGRGFQASDVAPGASVVIVNRSFASKVLGNRNALGSRLRYVDVDANGNATPGRWYEIVGIVEDLRSNPIEPDANQANMYFPVAVSQLRTARVLVRLKLAVNLTLPGRVLQIVTDELPALRAGAVSPWNGVDREGQLVVRLVAMIAILIMLSVLVLSAAGIYALTSFTVTQRWREIGVRTALGGTSARVLTGVFSRVAMQVGLGIAVGIGGAIALEPLLGKDVPRLEGLLPAVVMLVMVVGFAAAAGPARRALRIQPTDALRSQ